MNKWIIGLIFVLTCALAACQWAPAKRAANAEFAEQWIRGLVCEFPCWQNITPGTTKFVDVSDILSAGESVKITFIADDGMEF